MPDFETLRDDDPDHAIIKAYKSAHEINRDCNTPDVVVLMRRAREAERQERRAHRQITDGLVTAVGNIFTVQIVGRWSYRSEFGIPYVTICNGMPCEEGAVPVDNDIHTATGLTLKWFHAERGKGLDALVWRRLPEIVHEGSWLRLSMRCHAVTKKRLLEWMLADHLSSGSVGVIHSDSPPAG